MKIEQDGVVEKKGKKQKNKSVTIILILILVTLLIVLGIVMLIAQIKERQLAVYVDGRKVNVSSDIFMFTENNDKIYISIKDIAPIVGYEAHNGEYKVNVEDVSKMYVEAINGTETTSFYLNSNLISKVAPDSTDDYDNIEINEPITMINDKWYISTEGFMKAFNSAFSYDTEKNDIIIQTLPYLVSYYKANISNYGYDQISEDFNNQKALIYGMLVASKTSTEKYGVVNTRTRNEIISPRYNNIEFIESAEEFIITNASDKVGIAYSTGETKIAVLYDEIKVLNSSLGYYLVKSNSKYGVMNSEGELVVHIEYDTIGIDTEEFQADNIKNQYMLYDNLIPVCLNEKWGLFDKEGKKILNAEYDSLGCINTDITDRAVNNVLAIGDTEVVVVSKDELYGGISTRGDFLLPVMFEYIFSITSGGETNYYIVYNGIDYSAKEYIDIMKDRLGYNKVEEPVRGPGDTSSNPDNLNENKVSPETFNATFEAYEGEHSKNSTISLVDAVISSNASSENKIQIEYNGNIYVDDLAGIKESMQNDIYTMTIEKNAETGYIEKIIIK